MHTVIAMLLYAIWPFTWLVPAFTAPDGCPERSQSRGRSSADRAAHGRPGRGHWRVAAEQGFRRRSDPVAAVPMRHRRGRRPHWSRWPAATRRSAPAAVRRPARASTPAGPVRPRPATHPCSPYEGSALDGRPTAA
ncbi:hypothetical protein [Streptomyces sp. NPDC046727]|uniref:hypothetical protein n=1 Tax=Streptomyces sp. NPDC046727 TaxID=3155373 RepID=UPI0033E9F10D